MGVKPSTLSSKRQLPKQAKISKLVILKGSRFRMDEANIRVKMQSALDLVRADVGSIRTGRASPALVEDLVITAYGGTQKLKVIELATIHASDQTLLISPFDKSISLEIKKGIEEANVGLNPQVTGQDIRINLEPLTQEDRENYIKILK